jgi:KUP system potassium uptake protein
MLITTALFYFATRRVFGWPTWRAALLCSVFVLLELVFFGANAAKITHGGWFPLLVALTICTIMYTWKRGRRVLYDRHTSQLMAIDAFFEGIRRQPPVRVPGTAVYMSGSPVGAPLALLHNLKHNKVLHEQVLLLTIQVADDPHVTDDQRIQHENLPQGFHRIVATYGFMEQPHVIELLEQCQDNGLGIRLRDATFFLSRETIVPWAKRGHMPLWRSQLFAFLQRNAQPPTAYFGLPANRVVELGVMIEY